MTRRNYELLTGVVLAAILLTAFSFFIVPTISYGSVEQDRTACLSVCNDPTGDLMFYGGNSLWQLRAMCNQKCENKFWKEWQKEMNNAGKN